MIVAAQLVLLSYFCFLTQVWSSCVAMNDCNGHGKCHLATMRCQCFEGWGSATDIAQYKAPDCSERVCPSGRSWGDLPTGEFTAHALAECSDRGFCNRETGACECEPGFEGEACQRLGCPEDCSGHGQCFSMRQLARRSDAFPLCDSTSYEGEEVKRNG